MTDYTGKRTGNYTIVEKLGEGGFATVFLGKHSVLEKTVAVKFLLEEWINEPDVVSRFFDEARTMERLSEHPNIVKIIDVASPEKCQSEGLPPYFIMDYVDGPSLESRIKSDDGFTLEFVVEVMKCALDALEYCHSRGVVHRDIKPSNILISKDDKVKLTDFGIAKARLNTSKTGIGLTLGSTDYMSPEQALGKRDLDHRSDIYSIGVTLYEMVVGRLPFEGDNPNAVALMHIQDWPKAPIEINDAVPPRLNSLILKAMAKEADARFQSCKEMIEALEHIYDEEKPIEVEAQALDLSGISHSLPESELTARHEAIIEGGRTRSATSIKGPILAPRLLNVVRMSLIVVLFTVIFVLSFVLHGHLSKAQLKVVTVPSGSLIYVGDNVVGTSPVELALAPGEYRIGFELEGFEDAAIKLGLQPRQTYRFERQMKQITDEYLNRLDSFVKSLKAARREPQKTRRPLEEKALSDIFGLLEDNPDREEIHKRFVGLARSAGVMGEAAKFYSRHAEDAGSHVIFKIMHGRIHYLMGQKQAALEAYTRAWYQDSNDLTLLNYLGEYFLKEKNFSKARAYYQLSLFLKPDQPEVQKALDGL